MSLGSTYRSLLSILPLAPLAAALAAAPAAAAAAPAAASPAAPATAIFSMYCYWNGEATLGAAPGVLATRIGSLGGEVVEVQYDPAKTDVGRLAAALKRQGQGGFYALIVPDEAAKARAKGFRLADPEIRVEPRSPRFEEPKYSLRTAHPELYYLDLTEAQAMALNSWSYFGGPLPDVLMPEQKALLERVKAKLAGGRGRNHGEPDLHPERAGAYRQAYRQQLVAWLGK
jgi:hypothetical protein